MLGRRVKNIASSGLIKTARKVRHQFQNGESTYWCSTTLDGAEFLSDVQTPLITGRIATKQAAEIGRQWLSYLAHQAVSCACVAYTGSASLSSASGPPICVHFLPVTCYLAARSDCCALAAYLTAAFTHLVQLIPDTVLGCV
jgi:hypothetical protein